MQKIIVDNRMHNEIKEYFVDNGYEVLELEKQETVYEEISSHVDIFFSKIGNSIVYANNLITKNIELEKYIKGSAKVLKNYPYDTPYNVCIMGKTCICNVQNTSVEVIDLLKKSNYNVINVRQGYAKCSIAVTSENSCITMDKGIYKELLKHGIDVLFIEEKNIKLIKDNKFSQMKGFIGGATAVLANEFIVFGDINKLENKDKIIEHIKKYKLKLKDFKGLDVIDCGGIMEV